MILLRLLEFILFVVLIVGCITQIIIPELKGGPWFPSFNRRHKLEKELIDTEEKVEEKKVEKQINQTRRKL